MISYNGKTHTQTKKATFLWTKSFIFLKGGLRKNKQILKDFMDKAPRTKFCVVLISSHEVTKFWIRHEWRHTHECTKYFIPGFLCIFLLILWKKKLLQFYARFDHFWWTYKVTKFWMIKLSRHKWRHTCKYANYGLHVNFWKFWWKISF